MFKTSSSFHNAIYWGSLILLSVSLPCSLFLLSLSQIILMANWLLEGNFHQKWLLIKNRPAVWIIGLFYLMHLIGMIYTTNQAWGVNDLKGKLPLLILPLVIGTSTPLTKKQFSIILNCFAGSVLIFTLYSAWFIFGFDGKAAHSVNDISPFVSHIRWALMVDMAVFSLLWLFDNIRNKFRGIYILLILWFTLYIFLLQSLTGIIVFIITSGIMLLRKAFRSRQLMVRWFMVVASLTLLLLVSSYLIKAYARFYTFEKIDVAHLDEFTSKGNIYQHHPELKFVENGHYIYLYICEPELRETWKKRSSINFDGKTSDGGELKACLIRYLASKGFRKDSDGVNKLTNREIKYIEAGKTNYIDTLKYGFYPRIYQSIWEVYNYMHGANPTGYSIAQRFEFAKTSIHIITDNFWFGVGTGDIAEAFDLQYEKDKTMLAPENRFRAHNQFLRFGATFGIVGLTIILFSLIAPPFFEHKYKDYLFLCIFIISFLSFINEDTLETHHGISFVAFFYALFLYYKNPDNN
ncbi:MAG: O-antigen ligase family protein [Bacteroidota bacterium]|nr:O-antigen ligase family protein [Bacteroidota bacterium]